MMLHNIIEKLSIYMEYMCRRETPENVKWDNDVGFASVAVNTIA